MSCQRYDLHVIPGTAQQVFEWGGGGGGGGLKKSAWTNFFFFLEGGGACLGIFI